MPTGHRPPRIVTSQRLTLRPLTAQDAVDDQIIGWHTDPAGYELMYEQPYPDAETAAQHLRAWAARWRSHGIGYWIAEYDGAPVGIGGVDPLQDGDTDYLNLFYRLDSFARGRGLARELSSAATAFAAEWAPDRAVIARIAPGNVPSLRTARGAGLVDVGPWRAAHDPADAEPSRLHLSPIALCGPVAAGTAVYEEVLDLWCAVNDAGGAVGFETGAAREAVASALDLHLQDEATTLVRLHAPTADSFRDRTRRGKLLGFGFVVGASHFAIRHRCSLMRVMTSPNHRGSNLGRLLVGALHAVARADGREIVTISYRGGTGLDAFYQRCGYVETGRIPGGLRFSFGDRDDVDMARRFDGRPLQ